MNFRIAILMMSMAFATQACADARGGVWFYQPDGASYRVDSRSYRYDPRSPYPQHRQYQQNLPPRYQGHLPQQYYDRHRGSARPGWDADRRATIDRLQQGNSWRAPRFDRDDRRHESHRIGRSPLMRHGQDRRFGQGFSRHSR